MVSGGSIPPLQQILKPIKMNKQKLSKKLADNLKYFTDNPERRCVDNYTCNYSGVTLGIKTKGCFVGALLPQKLRLEIDEEYADGIAASELSRHFPIPKWMDEHSGIMDAFQRLHDHNRYWNENGLSDTGKLLLFDKIIQFELVEDEFKHFL